MSKEIVEELRALHTAHLIARNQWKAALDRLHRKNLDIAEYASRVQAEIAAARRMNAALKALEDARERHGT